MMNETAIGWTDLTWNPWSGCKVKSAGCKFCYAEQLAEKRRGTKAFPNGFELTVRPRNFDDPVKALQKYGPSLIFCESMSDIALDDDDLTPGEVDRLTAAGFRGMDHLRDRYFWAVLRAPEHRYQLVTKRPAQLLAYVQRTNFRPEVIAALRSCWVGVTLEHVGEAQRLDTLRAFRSWARVLFVSAEPLLSDFDGVDLDGIDWVIGGGESGLHASDPRFADRLLVRRVAPEHRHIEPHGWVPTDEGERRVRSVHEAARRAGAAFFFKQWGGPQPSSGGRLLWDREWDELPEHVPGAMPPGRRPREAATAGLARKLPVVQS